MQKDRSKILGGVPLSIAQKVSQMVGKFNFDSNALILMTGGLSRSAALVEIISKTVGLQVTTHELAGFAGAVGVCVSAKAKEGQRG